MESLRLGGDGITMNWTCLAESKVTCSDTDFYSGVEVWLRRPNVVNKRVLGAVVLQEVPLEEWLSDSQTQRDFEWLAKFYKDDILRQSAELEFDTGSKFLLQKILPKSRSVPPGREAVFIDTKNHRVIFVPLSTVSPSSAAVTEGSDQSYAPGGEPYMLRFTKERDEIASVSLHICSSTPTKVGVPPSNGVTVPTSEWLSSVLFPKIVKWSSENAQRSHKATPQQQVTRPNVPLDRYSQLYSEMKDKYGAHLVDNWPEATDPHKFVYEDIAIATYLLVLWEEERRELGLIEKQSFIDLGCGNGLLVYLLSSEGHPGKGIDLRERKIWRMFGRKANLEVCTLTPSDSTLFPGFDWLLGNHSDELTPWIPLMAARSSFNTRYFVLPCCAHDFNRKFLRPNTKKSQYRSYLDYVRHIGEAMGFEVEEDTMRIPSSKRVCQIGKKRTYTREREAEIDRRRKDFLLSRCRGDHTKSTSADQEMFDYESKDDLSDEGFHFVRKGSDISKEKSHHAKNVDNIMSKPQECTNQKESLPEPMLPVAMDTPTVTETARSSTHSDNIHSDQRECLDGERSKKEAENVSVSGGVWAPDFKPRDAKEHVRNCSQVDRGIKEHIVDTITKKLLKTENNITIHRSPFPTSFPHSTTCSSSTSGNSLCSASLPCTGHEIDRNCNNERSPFIHCSFSTLNTECHNHGKEVIQKHGGEIQSSPCQSVHDDVTVEWNRGGKLHLNEAVQMFDQRVLKELKREFGGLQTLLRNEHQIFEVSKGFIQLRNWSQMDHPSRKPSKPSSRCQQDAKKLLLKTKLCWFHEHHPQGCPRQAVACPYAHGVQELRERPDFKTVLDCSSVL